MQGNPEQGQSGGGSGGGASGNGQRLVSLPPSSTSRLLLGPRQGHWTPYDSKADRPLLQLTLRTALWGALAVGCIGGVVAIARPAGEAAPPADEITDHDWIVPGPVSGVAEETVQRWLTATDEQRDGLASLFVEPPPAGIQAPSQQGAGLQVTKVRAVAGQLLQEGYWSVTVAVEVTLPAGEEPTTTAPQPTTTTTTTTWFVEIGIVGDGHGGFKALSTPAVVPAPQEADPEWQVVGQPEVPADDDPLADTVEKFLNALLAGNGDAAPYMAPGNDIVAADPAPFAQIEVVDLTTKELDAGAGTQWVLARVQATTPDGVVLPLSYDLNVVDRGDRWEIQAFSGVPTYIE